MTQGISFHYCLWWIQALEEDKTCLMQFFFLPLKQESQCDRSKIVRLLIAGVELTGRLHELQQSQNATGTYLESCEVEGRVVESLFPKLVIRVNGAFLPLDEFRRSRFLKIVVN